MPADIHALCGQPVTLIRDDAALYYVHTATGTEDCPAAPGVHLQLTTPDIGISTEYSAALDKITDVLRDNLDENDEVEPIELAALVAEAVGLEQLIDGTPATSNDPAADDLQLTAEDFGPSRHGVHIFENEDGDWFAYGHHSARRIAAAINHASREYGGDVSELTLDNVRAEMSQCWGNNPRRSDGEIRWNFCKPGDPGAFPFTAVLWP